MEFFDKISLALALWGVCLLYAAIFPDSKDLKQKFLVSGLVCFISSTLVWVFS